MFGRAVGSPSVAGQHTIEALGEDLARARWHITEPPAAVDSQPYGMAAPGQIERAPLVSAVLPSRVSLREADSLLIWKYLSRGQASTRA
jgi:hypothetical protein